MKASTFWNALRSAGLDEKTSTLLVENKLLMVRVVDFAKSECQKFKKVFAGPGTAMLRQKAYTPRKKRKVAAIAAPAKKKRRTSVKKKAGKVKNNRSLAASARWAKIRAAKKKETILFFIRHVGNLPAQPSFPSI